MSPTRPAPRAGTAGPRAGEACLRGYGVRPCVDEVGPRFQSPPPPLQTPARAITDSAWAFMHVIHGATKPGRATSCATRGLDAGAG